MNGFCDRCHERTNVTCMSYFNTDTLCMKCLDKEKAHSKYAEAKEIENEAVRNGNYNFAGVGLPSDL